MNPHVKTVLTLLSGVLLLAAMLYSPTFAFIVYGVMWAFVGIMVCVYIYFMIYLCYARSDTPVYEDDEDWRITGSAGDTFYLRIF